MKPVNALWCLGRVRVPTWRAVVAALVLGALLAGAAARPAAAQQMPMNNPGLAGIYLCRGAIFGTNVGFFRLDTSYFLAPELGYGAFQKVLPQPVMVQGVPTDRFVFYLIEPAENVNHGVPLPMRAYYVPGIPGYGEFSCVRSPYPEEQIRQQGWPLYE